MIFVFIGTALLIFGGVIAYDNYITKISESDGTVNVVVGYNFLTVIGIGIILIGIMIFLRGFITLLRSNNWSEEDLEHELENRKTILKWMIKTEKRDYREVGRIVAEYESHPQELLEKINEELNQSEVDNLQ